QGTFIEHQVRRDTCAPRELRDRCRRLTVLSDVGCSLDQRQRLLGALVVFEEEDTIQLVRARSRDATRRDSFLVRAELRFPIAHCASDADATVTNPKRIGPMRSPR